MLIVRIKTWPSWREGSDGRGMGYKDVLIVAGDVSSSLERLLATLSEAVDRYDEVRTNTGIRIVALTSSDTSMPAIH